MKTFGDCKVGDKLYIVNNNGTIDFCDIQNIKYKPETILVECFPGSAVLSIDRTHERFIHQVVCSNLITAKSILEELQENINFSLKKLENENI
jgi:hypothetical protein